MSSNPKTALGMLTMAAPIVLLGAICTLATIWYTLTQLNEISHTGSTETVICKEIQYLQILNGVCTRGKVNNIQASSCMEWTDAAAWQNLDKKNKMLNEVAHLPHTLITQTASEVTSKWIPMKNLLIVTIPLSVINFVMCLVVADADLEFMDLDLDQISLVLCAFFNTVVLIFFIVAIAQTYNSELINPETWTTAKCRVNSAPSFAYFLMCLGGFFALVSIYISVYSYIHCYIYPPKEDPDEIKDGPLPAFDEREEDDSKKDDLKKDEEKKGEALRQPSPFGSRPNSVAPAPKELYPVALG